MAFVNINIYGQPIPRKDNKLRVKLEDLVKHVHHPTLQQHEPGRPALQPTGVVRETKTRQAG
jgi:hypothetical protein